MSANVFVEELDTIEGNLLGLNDCFEQILDTLKEKIESPDIKKYIQQGVANQETMKSDFFMIAAVCKNNGIGYMHKLPWKLAKELAYFNKMTTESDIQGNKNVLIMGRKTWNSIPKKFRPLQDRTNVVLSRTVSTIEDRENVDHIFSKLSDALEGVSQLRNKGQVWIIGGQSIYEEAIKMPQCKRIYLTKIDAKFECDTFFPEVDPDLYKPTIEPKVPQEEQEENGIKYKFHVYERAKDK